MKTFDIIGPDEAIRPALVEKINNLTKPKGSLGMLESLALQVGLIQQSMTPILQHPQNIIFAADHGIVEEGVSLSPKEITWQQISNFLHGGAGVNFLCRQHGFTLKIVDAGVDYDLPYEKGTITDTDFQSEWLNLKFTPPETVVMNTEEELQSVMKQGQTTLEESSGVELGDDALSGTVYEMMASSISGFPNVSLVVEDASLENMTVDQYFLAAQQMLDATGMGYTYSDVTDIQIAGQDFRIMETSVAVNDYEVLQKYCTRKQGGKFVSIILSYTTDTTAEADEILAAFTPLNTDTEAAPAE